MEWPLALQQIFFRAPPAHLLPGLDQLLAGLLTPTQEGGLVLRKLLPTHALAGLHLPECSWWLLSRWFAPSLALPAAALPGRTQNSAATRTGREQPGLFTGRCCSSCLLGSPGSMWFPGCCWTGATPPPHPPPPAWLGLCAATACACMVPVMWAKCC